MLRLSEATRRNARTRTHTATTRKEICIMAKTNISYTNDLGFILYDYLVPKYGTPIYADKLVEFYEVELPTSRCRCAKCGAKLPLGSLQYKMVDSQSRNGGYTVHKDCPMDRTEGSEWGHEKGNHDVRDIDSNNVDNHRVIVKSNKFRCEWLKRHGFHDFVESNTVAFTAENGWNTGHVLPQFIDSKVDEDEITVSGVKVSAIEDYYVAIHKRV